VPAPTPNKSAGRHIEHAVFSIELVDRRAAAHRVAFAEDLLKVAVKQFVDTVIHNISFKLPNPSPRILTS
jgi:hypothetical protein